MGPHRQHAAVIPMALQGILLGAYCGLWHAAKPLLRRHKRLKEGFDRRLVPNDWLPGDWVSAGIHAPSPPTDSPHHRIWIQAASGGEARLVQSFLPELAKAFQNEPDFSGHGLSLLCTTCTRQGLDVLHSIPVPTGAAPSSLRLVPEYFPLDRPDLMRKALRLAAPELIILLETELWPGLLTAAKEAGIPVIVLNARMTEKSRKAYFLTRKLWAALAPAAVLAIAEDDAKRFSEVFNLGNDVVGVMPNIKFDVTAAALQADGHDTRPLAREAALLPSQCRVAALASVREEEEQDMLTVASFLQTHASRSAASGPLLVALAPRHMHRVNVWEQTLSRNGIPYIRRTQQKCDTRIYSGDKGFGVVLWDTFGELPRLYAAADAVFVGGSLAPLGGQNFLEPLGKGVIPLVGPHLSNFSWVGDELFTLGLARRVDNAKELGAKLLDALTGAGLAQNPEHSTESSPEQAASAIRRRFAAWLHSRTGGARQAAALALSFLSR
ncbi:3-deoxy-D-manno-octulosonic acid transferase [Desulfovibrio sp. OttesenSCG-928-G15]|nr:3-deoxy-D-manno-octulosonic acid transferase [Desulfovibrio sp. OttesenSCG-928-G15]